MKDDSEIVQEEDFVVKDEPTADEVTEDLKIYNVHKDLEIGEKQEEIPEVQRQVSVKHVSTIDDETVSPGEETEKTAR